MSISRLMARLGGASFLAAVCVSPFAPAFSQDALVQSIQTELKRGGYYQGVVDGLSGPQTAAAISSFEEATGRAVTGKPSEELLAALTAAGDAEEASDTLSADEMEVLVARIALYPDDLVAAIIASSLYPLQIVQAARFLEDSKTDKSLKPSDKWDGSVISLLNTPEVVKMMNDDLEWTEQLGEAAVNQQQDLLVAIQQLRDKAVASKVLASNDKVVVEEQNDNIVIKSSDPEVVYVPTYEPQALYEPEYVSAGPAVSYSEPYPSYYYPTATYWPALVTGAIWGAVVDWDDWDTWGGDVDIDVDIDDIGDIDLDFDNIDIDRDNINFDRNNVDWRNVDRSKIKFDKGSLDRDKLKRNLERSGQNKIADRGRDGARDRAGDRAGGKANKAGRGKDVRRDVQQGLKGGGGQRARPEGGDRRSAANRPAQRPTGASQRDRSRSAGQSPNRAKSKKPSQKKVAQKRTSKPKAAAKRNTRPNKPSAIGSPSKGKSARMQSNRGYASRGGGHRGGGHKAGRRPASRGGRGGGGGGRRR